jgi:hypothetical protein
MSDRMPIQARQAEVWTLSADRRLVRMQLPELAIGGLPKPLRIHLDFDAATVDEILLRLTELRAQMLPPPERH